MLDKDQYNQDEYNNYYKQETEGAGIKGYSEDEGGFMGKAILFLGLIALGVAGYFGFKVFNSTTEGSNTQTKEKIVIKEEDSKSNIGKEIPQTTEKEVSESIEDKVIKTIETNKIENNNAAVTTEKSSQELKEQKKSAEEQIEKTIQKEVANQVQEKLENNQKMSTKDISKIVDLVMDKMNKEKIETSKTNQDNNLINALENNDADTLEIESKTSKVVSTDNSEIAIEEKSEKGSSYNKVTLDDNSQDKDKTLTELSEQIKKILNMTGVSTKTSTKSPSTSTTEVSIENNNNDLTNYEESISQEIKVRSNEMRVIIVKPGDTLNKIAERAYGDASNYQKIFDANPDILNRADRIYVGQKLRIPK